MATGACGRAVGLCAQRGLTLVELAVALTLVAVLGAIAVPSYQGYRERVRIDQAKRDIMVIATAVAHYQLDARAYPNGLSDVGLSGQLDPWGNAYRYLNLETPGARGQARKDHALVPINTDFDLYSMGADGGSSPPLTARQSRDDVVRANNGAFVGLASEY
jgi:general secretion pathway protein G